MNRVFWLSSVIAIGLACAAARAATPADALVGHWRLDDRAGSKSATDSAHLSNPARCGHTMALGSGVTQTVTCPRFGTPGRIGTAAAFRGHGNFLVVHNSIPDSFTITAWIKTTEPGEGGLHDPAYRGTGIIWSDKSGAAADMIPMALQSGHLSFGTGDCRSGNYDTLISTGRVNTGGWVFVAVTRDRHSGEKRLYVGGRLEARHHHTGTCALNANPIIIFGGNPLDHRYFKGALDDIRFYDRALSAGEIKALANPPAVVAMANRGAKARPAATPAGNPAGANAGPPPSAAAMLLPATYSLVIKARSSRDMNVAIYHDRSRELVVLSRAPGPARPGGWASRMWYDFNAHKQYANDTNAPNQCSVIKYTSAVAPPLLDPVAGAAQMTAQMPKDLPVAGKTSIDGVKVEFLKASGKDGTLKVWRDPVHHLVIRAVMVLPSKSAQTLIDLSGISFAKPDPALLAPPKNCHAIKGESNANGGHAEVPIGAPR